MPPAIEGEAAAFLMMNRNKRGIALDLKTAGGRRVLARLLEDADVVVENYRPGTMERLGFDYEALRADNPGLIYCALSGFGRTGPYGHRGGFDLVAQAISGIMSITGEGPGRPPVKCGAPLTDITCGILAAMGILAAYAHRLKTGQGQMVETSLLEAGIVQTYWQSAIALATGERPRPDGLGASPERPLPGLRDRRRLDRDRRQQPDRLWQTHARGAGRRGARRRPALSRQRRPHGPSGRARGRRLPPTSRPAPSADLLAAFEAAGVPAGPVNDVLQMHADPQVRARDMVVEVEHADARPRSRPWACRSSSPTRPGKVRTGAPLYGQHTREVLAEHGFTDAEIDVLAAEGAVVLGEAP